jgi:excisionase family DNA binding protein
MASITKSPASAFPFYAAGPDPLAVTIPDACRMLGIGRTKFYELIGAGDVRAIRVAGRTLIEVASLRTLVSAAPAWKGGA